MPEANLTKKYVDSLKTGARGGTRYFDTDLHGFGVKVHPTGKKVFFVMYGPREIAGGTRSGSMARRQSRTLAKRRA